MKITPELIAAAVQHLPEGHVEGDIILNIDDYEWRRFVATVGLPAHFAADPRDTVLPIGKPHN